MSGGGRVVEARNAGMAFRSLLLRNHGPLCWPGGHAPTAGHRGAVEWRASSMLDCRQPRSALDDPSRSSQIVGDGLVDASTAGCTATGLIGLRGADRCVVVTNAASFCSSRDTRRSCPKQCSSAHDVGGYCIGCCRFLRLPHVGGSECVWRALAHARPAAYFHPSLFPVFAD